MAYDIDGEREDVGDNPPPVDMEKKDAGTSDDAGSEESTNSVADAVTNVLEEENTNKHSDMNSSPESNCLFSNVKKRSQ